MGRIGAEADPQLTAELLYNVPGNPEQRAELEAVFQALTPEQQAEALRSLQEIYASKRLFNYTELAINMPGILGIIFSLAIPDVMERAMYFKVLLLEKHPYGQPPVQ